MKIHRKNAVVFEGQRTFAKMHETLLLLCKLINSKILVKMPKCQF